METVHDSALEALDKKLRLIDDRVNAVVLGNSTGFYLCGAGGLGKSFSVFKQLRHLDCEFRAFNSRMTAFGLFRALGQAPTAVHILEDMERLTNDRDAQGVLRSALWSQGDRERVVTWTTGQGEQRFTFQGGLIMLANRPLADMPELRALASRITIYKLEVSDKEMSAHMLRIASNGWSRYRHKLEAAHCIPIAEYVIAESLRASCPIDLRLLDHACMDFLMWEQGNTHLHWHDLVTTHIQQSAHHFRHEISTRSREEQKEYERGLVREIVKQTSDAKEQVRLWEQMTGKRHSAFYTRKREVDSREFDI
jgi:hypothetical protein